MSVTASRCATVPPIPSSSLVRPVELSSCPTAVPALPGTALLECTADTTLAAAAASGLAAPDKGRGAALEGVVAAWTAVDAGPAWTAVDAGLVACGEVAVTTDAAEAVVRGVLVSCRCCATVAPGDDGGNEVLDGRGSAVVGIHTLSTPKEIDSVAWE